MRSISLYLTCMLIFVSFGAPLNVLEDGEGIIRDSLVLAPGSNGLIFCNYSIPKQMYNLSVHWVRNGEKIEPNEGNFGYDTSTVFKYSQSEEGHDVLKINNADRGIAGNYTCVYEFPDGVLYSSLSQQIRLSEVDANTDTENNKTPDDDQITSEENTLDKLEADKDVENIVWCAYKDKFLYIYVSGNYVYETLKQAQTMCSKRTDCGGITQEPKNNNRYTLRKESTLKQSPSGEMSWKECGDPGIWCSYSAKFLSEYSSGDHFYQNLLTAQRECMTRSDCSGVTWEPKHGNRYTLRKQSTLKQSPSGEMSWKECEDPGIWCSYSAKFLSEYSSGDHFYQNLLTAQWECMTRSDCSGVTREPKHGNRYTLRKKSTLIQSPSGEVSWKKC